MATPDTSWLPAGMDPKSSFSLQIRLICNRKKLPKDLPCFKFSKVVDSNVYTFERLVREITDQYPHGYLEIVHVFYFDDAQKCFPKVRSDEELVEMFSKHVSSKVVRMTIMYTDPTDPVPIPECYTPENSELLDIPCTPSMACPTLPTTSQSTEPTCSQPTKRTTSEPIEPTTNEPSVLHDDENLKNPEPQNEHVGVDDECLYIAVPTPKAHVVQDSDLNSDSDSDSESDEEYEEEEGLIGKDPVPPVPVIAYDRDDPPMSVGSLYPSIKEFRLALSQHAIRHEFEYNTEKSDPGRLRAYCSKKE
ncbi:unnamed protein product [Urochloa humidicola]